MPAAADRRPQTSIDLLRARAQEDPAGVATYSRTSSGTWAPHTWSVLWKDVQQAAAALSRLGLERGDRLAVLARTRREWQIAEMGANLAGAAIVGVDAHASRDQIAWILDAAHVSGLVVDDADGLAKVPEHLLTGLKFVVVLGDDGPHPRKSDNVWRWHEAVTSRSVSSDESMGFPAPTDPATLIYTSGTSGTPKGIVYSHAQLMTACWAMLDEFPDFQRARMVCWLPMAALFQRMMNLVAMASRSVTYFVEDPREVVAHLGEIRPTIFTSVPRFYEKLHDGILEQVAKQSGVKRSLARAALKTGSDWSSVVRTGRKPTAALRLRHAIFDRLVLRRIRSVMGGEINWMISGSAAAPVWLLEFFHSLGFLVLEAYGVTENPVPVAANRPYAYRLGSVGKPFSVNSVRLADDGEVLVKGPALFCEYVGEGRPQERFTADDYYRTGDYGRFDSDGFLYLTGRIGEIIKTSTGRRISPAAVEGVYRQSRYVEQMVVVGNERPYLAALVVLNRAAVDEALGGIASSSLSADSAPTSAVIELVQGDLVAQGARLARHEQIHNFAILPAALSVENQELTPSLKLRRHRIEARHAETIERMYRREATL